MRGAVLEDPDGSVPHLTYEEGKQGRGKLARKTASLAKFDDAGRGPARCLIIPRPRKKEGRKGKGLFGRASFLCKSRDHFNVCCRGSKRRAGGIICLECIINRWSLLRPFVSLLLPSLRQGALPATASHEFSAISTGVAGGKVGKCVVGVLKNNWDQQSPVHTGRCNRWISHRHTFAKDEGP